MEKVKEIKSLNIITEQYNNLVVLLVFQKQQICKNVHIRVGYANTESVEIYFSTRYRPQEYFFTIPSVVSHECYIVPIPLRKHCKFSYIEIIDAENQTINFICQRATSVCNPYTALQKYTEIEVEVDQDTDVIHSQLVRDILDSSKITEDNIKILDTQTREELCENIHTCGKYNTVWIANKTNSISTIWANEEHWNVVHNHMNIVNKRTAWPIYDCAQIVQSMNQIGRNMILKLLLCSTLKKTNVPINGLLDFGEMKAVALCKLVIREALNNQALQTEIDVEYEFLDVDNHILHILYQNVLLLHNTPYNIIHYPKLCQKLGISDRYMKHIMFLLQQKQSHFHLTHPNPTLYIRQRNVWLYPNKYPIENTQAKLINALSINLPDKYINELLNEIIYHTDVVIKFDGISIVITSDLLPSGLTIESKLDQIVELENIAIITDLSKKTNKYIY